MHSTEPASSTSADVFSVATFVWEGNFQLFLHLASPFAFCVPACTHLCAVRRGPLVTLISISHTQPRADRVLDFGNALLHKQEYPRAPTPTCPLDLLIHTSVKLAYELRTSYGAFSPSFSPSLPAHTLSLTRFRFTVASAVTDWNYDGK